MIDDDFETAIPPETKNPRDAIIVSPGDIETDIPFDDETGNPIVGETEISGAVETQIPFETKIPETVIPAETKNRKRGRPRRETETPWAAAGVSRATWYRQRRQAAAT